MSSGLLAGRSLCVNSDALLKEHPGALVMPPAAYPLALVRLAHALLDAGYQAVAAPACAGCGRITMDLRALRPDPQDRQACDSISPRPVKRLLPRRAYVGQRTADDRRGIGTRKLANRTR
jgi:hypothetical protein